MSSSPPKWSKWIHKDNTGVTILATRTLECVRKKHAFGLDPEV